MAKRLGWLSCMVLLAACRESAPNPGSSGSGAGAGGDGANGGSVDMGGSAGVGSAGGTGAGGTGGECEASMPAGACSQLGAGWFAVKVGLDVWWQGSPVHDPGRGELAVLLLARVGEVCPQEVETTAELKVCGVQLPIITSDVSCDAYELSFDEATWETAGMPPIVTTVASTLSPGETFALAPWNGLLGVDLLDPAAGLPLPGRSDLTMCASGSWNECFPDQDQDQQPGVTLKIRNDDAPYVGPYDSGLCSSGAEYRLRGFSMNGHYNAGAGAGYAVRVTEAHVGVRAPASVEASIADDCASAVGGSSSDAFQLQATGCMLDPSTLLEPDPRVGSAHPLCNDQEVVSLDQGLPTYQVLQAGEAPRDSLPLSGWVLIGRDIPKTASTGPRSALFYLGDLTEDEPSCSTVRDELSNRPALMHSERE